jgi:uncharacterized protein
MKSRIFSLLTKHQRLDDALRSEQTQRFPDLTRIQQLKKLKLAVKDRLHRATQPKRTLQGA